MLNEQLIILLLLVSGVGYRYDNTALVKGLLCLLRLILFNLSHVGHQRLLLVLRDMAVRAADALVLLICDRLRDWVVLSLDYPQHCHILVGKIATSFKLGGLSQIWLIESGSSYLLLLLNLMMDDVFL